MSDPQLVYGLNNRVTTTGSLGIGTVKDEGRVRFVIENAGLSNVVRVRGRIVNQVGWDNLADLSGSVSQSVDVFTYDELEVIVLVYSSLSDHIFVRASSFDGSEITFVTPNGDPIENASQITFTSNDDSVTITGNNTTGEIDFSVNPGAGQLPYSNSFLTGDWALNVDSYELEYLEATHSKGANPIVNIFEANGLVFDEVESFITINSSGDITIKIAATPDLRFSGKVIIN